MKLNRLVAIIAVAAMVVPAVAQKSAADLDKKEKAMLAQLEKKYTTAKADYAKKPATKPAYIKATLAYADAVLVSPALGPREKYPKSLRLYREVRSVDPSNKSAKSNIDLIEGIYKSMGRPIPK